MKIVSDISGTTTFFVIDNSNLSIGPSLILDLSLGVFSSSKTRNVDPSNIFPFGNLVEVNVHSRQDTRILISLIKSNT